MEITRYQVNEMIAHAEAEYPNECCGLVAMDGDVVQRVYPCPNMDIPEPVTEGEEEDDEGRRRWRKWGGRASYQVDPVEQARVMLDIEQHGWRLGAIFHSHPNMRAYPSGVDEAYAYYPDCIYVIVGLRSKKRREIGAYMMNGNIEPVGIEIVEPEDPTAA